ncbi:MAG TPA: short-chain dehydrogenase [Erysipelotrichaceae bacterium]|nr:short-chain dehydrogenase [Erysipelotrichaceae bacterium]
MHTKIICLTGGNRGIGEAIAKQFIEEGAIVYSIDKEPYQGTLPIHFFVGDVSKRLDRELFVQHILTHQDHIDVIVNNAMESSHGILSDLDLDQFERILSIGITAPYHLAALCKDHMPEGSSIVNILSSRAFQSQKNTEAYSSAKGGLYALTHALANSLGPRIRVNAIAPGWIHTGQAELSPEDHAQHLTGHVGTVEDIAEMVCFLTSSKAKFITGETIMIDGGMSKRMIYHNDEGWLYHI